MGNLQKMAEQLHLASKASRLMTQVQDAAADALTNKVFNGPKTGPVTLRVPSVRQLTVTGKFTPEGASFDAAGDIAADVSDSIYGHVDRRAQQPGELRLGVPQGSGLVDVFYNPATREARPIPKAEN